MPRSRSLRAARRCWPRSRSRSPAARRSAKAAAVRASASIPGRTGTARSSTSTKSLDDAAARSLWRRRTRTLVPAGRAARRHQLLQQFRRRLVRDQQHAAGQVRARLRGRDPGQHEHPVRPGRRSRRRFRDGPRPPLRGLRSDARPLRRRRRRLRRPAASWGHRPCAMPARCSLDLRATPADPLRLHRRARRAHAFFRSSTPAPACSARRASSTTSRSTSTPSFATPTCSGGAAWSSTATSPRRRQRPKTPPRGGRRSGRHGRPTCAGNPGIGACSCWSGTALRRAGSRPP